jgi:polar amino acid transport system substrate-binding protein
MTRTRGLAVATLLALLLAACGGGEASDTTGAETPETTGAEAPETTEGETPETTGATAGCTPDSLPTFAPGVLTVATGEPVFPPWMIDDDPANKQGFESAVVYAVAEKLGYADDQVTWVRTGFDEAIAPGEKEYDFNVQQYSITEDRDEVVDFSAPYYTTNQALVAYEDSAAVDAATVADLQGLKLGAQIGTTSLAYIEDVIQPAEPASVFDDNVAAKAALDAKQVDGLVFDLPTAFFVTAVEIEGSQIVGVFEVSPDQADNFGFLMADGSALKPCVDQALEELRADGTLDALADEWIVTGSDLKTITS